MEEKKDLISSRRSIRRFTDQDISKEELDAILEAAMMAPTWGNLQCHELVVVRDAQRKQQLAELLSPKNPASKCTAQAPVVIAVCGKPLHSGYYKGEQSTRYSSWFMYDLGIVSENICLKACELGIGSVIVGFFNHDTAEQLLNVPKGVELVALIPLGFPAATPSAPKRRGLDEFVHYEQF